MPRSLAKEPMVIPGYVPDEVPRDLPKEIDLKPVDVPLDTSEILIVPIDQLIQFDEDDKRYPEKIKIDDTVMFMKDRYNIVTISESKEMLYYQNGVYHRGGEDLLKRQLTKTFLGYNDESGDPILDRRVLGEIITKVSNLTGRPIKDFEIKEPILNLREGILNLDTFELVPHSPEVLSLSQIPTRYNPDAECPGIMEKIDYHVPKKYHDVLFEMCGYTLLNNSDMQKAFMLFGEKRTFKGTFLRVLEAMIGSDNCSHVPLHKLVGDKFSVADIHGKMLNYSGDLTSKPLQDTEIFKNLTGQDIVWGQKKFGQPFSFRFNGKLIYAINIIPQIKEYDEAYSVKWITIPFENSVLGKEDPKLTAKLTTPEELSGFLNLSLEGLKRLQKNDKFSYDIDEGLKLFKRQSSPVTVFLEERYRPATDQELRNGEGYVAKAYLAKDFIDWAKKYNIPPMSKKAFGTIIQDQMIIPVETAYPRVEGIQVESWNGIRLNEGQKSLTDY